MDNRDKFVAWGVAQRGEDPKSLGERFDRFGAMVRNEDLVNDRNKARFPFDAARKVRAKLGERVLEIGTGSGYQSAYLAHLTQPSPARSRRRAAAHRPRRGRLLTSTKSENVVPSPGLGADRRCRSAT